MPLLGIAFLVYTIYKNVVGVSFPYNRFPILVGAWLIVGLLIIVLTPGLARRIGESLAREAGLEDTAAGEPAGTANPGAVSAD